MYRNDHAGKYPSFVTAYSNSTTDTNWSSLETALKPYISSLSKDPLNTTGVLSSALGYPYYYASGGGLCSLYECYDLAAKFEDSNNPNRCEIKQYVKMTSSDSGYDYPWCQNTAFNKIYAISSGK